LFVAAVSPPRARSHTRRPQQTAYVEWEKELMADVPGWKAEPFYKTRSYMPPALSSHPGAARQ